MSMRRESDRKVRVARHARAGCSLVALLGLSSGCYLAHGVPEGTPGDRDASSASADAGASAHDAAVDADDPDTGTLLPDEPDPDLGVDSRPSDYPDASDWEDPPPPGSSDPCCTLDEPIRVNLGREALLWTEPMLAWSGDRWGLLMNRVAFDYLLPPDHLQPIVYTLSRDGHPMGPPSELGDPDFLAYAFRYGEGRWAVSEYDGPRAGTSDRPTHSQVRLFDRALHPAMAWTIAPGFIWDVARLTSGHLWVALAPEPPDHLHAAAFTEGGLGASATLTFTVGQTLDAVGMRSRIAVLEGGYAGAPNGNAVTVLGGAPDFAVLGTVPLASRFANRAAIASLRDLVVAAVLSGTHVTVDLIDPFVPATVGPSREVATLMSSDGATGLDVAASSKLGLAGICWGESFVDDTTGPTIHERLSFRLVGPDGLFRGEPLQIAEVGSNCAVGSDDEGFLVAWFTGSELLVRRIHVRR